MLPAISSRLLVAQSVVADPNQAGFAAFDGMSGVIIVPNTPGVAGVSTEKLGLERSTHYVNWSAGVLEGEVTIETADEPSYTGPWTALQVITFGVSSPGPAPKQDMVIIDGAYACFRHRITMPVVGGSVTTKIVGTT